jgi:hypothetical protein
VPPHRRPVSATLLPPSQQNTGEPLNGFAALMVIGLLASERAVGRAIPPASIALYARGVRRSHAASRGRGVERADRLVGESPSRVKRGGPARRPGPPLHFDTFYRVYA